MRRIATQEEGNMSRCSRGPSLLGTHRLGRLCRRTVPNRRSRSQLRRHGTRLGCIVLAIFFLLAESVFAAIPEVSSAEWTEVSWPCNVAMGAKLVSPDPWREVGQSALAPIGYFTYGESNSGGPPANAFTATVDWGDGTTLPATVEAGSVRNCYLVSAPSHTYAATGTYPFYYVVHELETGVDHKLAVAGYPEFHIWSITPQLAAGPSLRAINAIVGVPWSGVVAEFNDGFPSQYLHYHAQIEWGDGEPPTIATVTPQASELAFTVSGSHTYMQPLNSTVRVLLTYQMVLDSNEEPVGEWTTGPVDATSPPTVMASLPPLRFRGQPILAVIPRGRGAPLYELVFRVNR